MGEQGGGGGGVGLLVYGSLISTCNPGPSQLAVHESGSFPQGFHWVFFVLIFILYQSIVVNQLYTIEWVFLGFFFFDL